MFDKIIDFNNIYLLKLDDAYSHLFALLPWYITFTRLFDALLINCFFDDLQLFLKKKKKKKKNALINIFCILMQCFWLFYVIHPYILVFKIIFGLN